ncbi:hypothetical protein HYH03_009661 [Edaphochlamys debaryana]|uniref:2-oxoadipate dioxygenase/decarboxylase n=1 Tax=Edaphochlamys debaryana TaxID=47281 RepID=A0A835XXC2_9CHLO|nr:hypothetical protein HYH03_009661 [Edaphochlamys debaryana]|eukprot:KAG2491926.1 hypothetical protein HYH03_009661 [Edaphochlamys debaryana]
MALTSTSAPARLCPLARPRSVMTAAAAAAASAGPASRLQALPAELVMELPKGCKVPPATLPLLHQVLDLYAQRTPRLGAVVDKVTRPGWPGVGTLGHDHFAFRTFGVPGLGISSLERVLVPLGYARVDDDPPLAFPNKRLVATWFTPADPAARAVLPRIFVSEIQVEKLSPPAQAAIREVTAWAAAASPEAVLVQVMSSLATGSAPWPRPSLDAYEALLAESEYAAWVMVHGYSLNHTALALHRLPPAGTGADIADFVARLQAVGLDMNAEGGFVKVSPDKHLLQCAVVADRMPLTFACGKTRQVAAAYVEFVQRLRLPQFAALRPEEVREEHLREGFEVGNADRIFHSTTLAAAGRG